MMIFHRLAFSLLVLARHSYCSPEALPGKLELPDEPAKPAAVAAAAAGEQHRLVIDSTLKEKGASQGGLLAKRTGHALRNARA